MPEIVHNIDLSSIPHRPGQSTDLEAKRQRAWVRLEDDEKEWVINAWDLTGMIPSAPAFRELQNASDRVLYVLVGTEESLTPSELSYLMISRWFRNIDSATARAKMAQLVSQGLARYTGIGRTMATESGLEKLEDLARPARQYRDDDRPGRSDHRQTTSRSRVVDRGESPRSSFGDYRAPAGRYRHEMDGSEPQRDSRGPRRDDRGGDSRGPRRDDRGGDSRGPRRDDRGGYSRGPRRDDRGGYSVDSRRNDRGGAPERGRVNTDGPVIDGWTPSESSEHGRVNTDGPVIDGRDKEFKSEDSED
jgi:hypothetical protein